MATKKTVAKGTSHKASAKKTSATKSAPVKEKTDSPAKNSTRANAKKTASKAPAKKGAGRKYGPAASKSVEREMKAMHDGTLRSGSGQKVTNPKQAIAIGLSEARKAGAKVPPPPPEK